MTRCPHCGGGIQPRRRRRNGGRLFQSTSRADVYSGSTGSGEDAERLLPQRTEEIKEPVAQASLRHNWAPALAVALTAGVIAFALLFPFAVFILKWPRPALWAYLVAGLVTAVVWYHQQGFFAEALFKTKNIVEDLLQEDLDGDGVVGAPAPLPEQRPGWVSIDGSRAQRNRQKSAIEQYREAVVRFVEIVWMRQSLGRRTGQKELRGHALPHGYKVDDVMHREVGDRLLENGLAESVGKGWVLVASPEEVAVCIEAWDGDQEPTAPLQTTLPELPN